MSSVLMIIVLWSWGLTPLWVNIIGTIILICRGLLSAEEFLRKNDIQNRNN